MASAKTNGKLKVKVPEGFQKRSYDIEHFWDWEKGPIQGVALAVKLSDSNQDEEKPSALLFVKLSADAVCDHKDPATDEKKEGVVVPKGTIVGVWVKPGMRDVADCHNVEFFMAHEGQKQTGKANPMELFGVYTADDAPRKLVPIIADNRKESKKAGTMFDPPADTPF